mgnify:CR=1
MDCVGPQDGKDGSVESASGATNNLEHTINRSQPLHDASEMRSAVHLQLQINKGELNV